MDFEIFLFLFSYLYCCLNWPIINSCLLFFRKKTSCKTCHPIQWSYRVTPYSNLHICCHGNLTPTYIDLFGSCDSESRLFCTAALIPTSASDGDFDGRLHNSSRIATLAESGRCSIYLSSCTCNETFNPIAWPYHAAHWASQDMGSPHLEPLKHLSKQQELLQQTYRDGHEAKDRNMKTSQQKR